MREKTLIIVLLLMILIKPALYSQKKEAVRGVYLHSCFVMPNFLEGFPVIGFGYKINSRWSIQLSGVLRKFKDRGRDYLTSSIYACFLDVKYELNRKPLNPYIIISEGLICENSIWIRDHFLWGRHEFKESNFFSAPV
jgi:hypothetical protein